MTCVHLFKMASFLHEINNHNGRMKLKDVKTYSHYSHRLSFLKTMNWLERKDIIRVSGTNPKLISLTTTGQVVTFVLENIFSGELNEF